MVLSISIIVPVYNVEKYIERCFQSIVNQTYSGPMECLFVDDCGNDNSIQILEVLIKAYDGPIEMRLLHHEKNKGLSGARNTGISNAKGDYLFFLDSDDQLYPNSISCLAKAAIKDNIPDVILGGYQVSIPNHPISLFCGNYEVISGQPAIAKAYLDDKLYCMAANKLVSRRFIVENSLYFKEGIIHEDNLWSFQSFHLAQKVVIIPAKTYFYDIREGSIMTSVSYERSLECTKVIYDEIKSDIRDERYGIVDPESVIYIKKRLNEKCVDVLLYCYYQKYNRRERLQKLNEIPNEIKQMINQNWMPSGMYSKVIKKLFTLGLYRIFDGIVMCYMFIQKEL